MIFNPRGDSDPTEIIYALVGIVQPKCQREGCTHAATCTKKSRTILLGVPDYICDYHKEPIGPVATTIYEDLPHAKTIRFARNWLRSHEMKT
jgi:hypothetical protein